MRQYVPVTARHGFTQAAMAHSKLAFERIERTLHRRRFANA
jgi:hypothetical protein